MNSTACYVRWQDGDMWLGYFEQFPEYLTQGESSSELEGNRRVRLVSEPSNGRISADST